MLKIIQIRKSLGLTQKEFSDYTGIPIGTIRIGTIRNWEQEIRKPPEYVFNMIFKILERDMQNMPNIETIKFIKLLDELAEKTLEGFKEWMDVESSKEINGEIIYDNFKGIMFDSSNDNKVISDTVLAPEHHDILGYYEDFYENGCSIRVIDSWETEGDDIPEDDRFFIQIDFILGDSIVVHDGRWYFV